MFRHAFVHRQQVIGQHAESYQQRAALGRRIDRNIDAQWFYEVRSDLPQVATFVQGLVDEWNLTILEVSQAAVDQAARCS